MVKKKKSPSIFSKNIHFGLVIITLLIVGLIFVIFISLAVKTTSLEDKSDLKVLTYPSGVVQQPK